MAKDWLLESDSTKFKHETLLNYGLNRWGLNKAHTIDATSALIRRCGPSAFEEWERFYFNEAKQKRKDGLKISREYIKDLGQKLYVKLSEVVHKELSSITEEECIDYVYNLVLHRTYNGYITEIETIYGQLEQAVGEPIKPADDEWDRTYSVDFYIKINGKYIGIQIKPIESGLALNQYQWVEMHMVNHQRFKNDFGGEVFFVYSQKSSNGKKKIYNEDVIGSIINEIKRLKGL